MGRYPCHLACHRSFTDLTPEENPADAGFTAQLTDFHLV